YAAQLRFKEQIVRDQLQRIGGIPNPVVHPTIPSPDPWYYRSHVTFSVTPEGQLGFVSTDNVHVLPISECHIIRPELLELFHELAFDLPTLNRVRLQIGSATDDRLVALSTWDDEVPGLESDIRASVNFLPSDNVPVNLIGAAHVEYIIKGRAFRVTAGSFFQ